MSAQIDLLLVNPRCREEAYQNLGHQLAAIEPPIWCGLFASFIRRRGFSVAILDAEAENLGIEAAAQRILAHSPRLTAVVVYGHHPSASTQNMDAVGLLCNAVKAVAPEQKLILVGGHVAALPERTLEEELTDFVCDGEGPYTLAELLQALKSGGGPELYPKVRGLCYRDGDRVIRNAPAPLVQDLDGEMPHIPWELLPMDRYRAHNWHCFGDLERQPYAAFYTTLGCPYHCSFCCIQAPFKSGERLLGLREAVNSYRYWSAETVAAQVDRLVSQYGVRNIKIADEMFVLHPRHVEALCDVLIARDYDLNLWAYARVDTVRPGMLDKLRRAGFRWLAFGIEAASEKVRSGVEKGFSQEQIFDTLRRVREAGIHVIGNFIFGLPDDDLGSMQETLDMALELQSEFVNFYSTMAYPGSALYEEALRQKLPLPKTWAGYSQHSIETLPLPTRHVSSAEVLAFRDRAFQTYFNQPAYLQMMREKFGARTLAHLRDMTSEKLLRRYAPEAEVSALS